MSAGTRTGTKRSVLKSAVGGDFGRQVLDAASAAAFAQDVAVQRVTASALPLGGQQESAFLGGTQAPVSSTQLGSRYETGSGFWSHLTDVTIHVEAAIQSDYPDRLLLTLLRHDGLAAHRTARCVLPARETREEKKEDYQDIIEDDDVLFFKAWKCLLYRWKSSMQWI